MTPENASSLPIEPDAGGSSAPLPMLPRPEILGQPVTYAHVIPQFAVNSTLSYRPSRRAGSRRSGRSGMSRLEERAHKAIEAAGVFPYQPEPEFRFCADLVGPGTGLRARLAGHPLRLQDWRFDLAFVRDKIACELEGGIWNGGRHTRGVGYSDDCRKYNIAQILGWTVLRFTDRHVKSGEFVTTLRAAFGI